MLVCEVKIQAGKIKKENNNNMDKVKLLAVFSVSSKANVKHGF
jgi:hypothetical protein